MRPARRIASLLPAATDLVAALGAADLLVGRSHECDWPAEVSRVPALTRAGIAPDASSREIDAAVAHRGSGLYVLDRDALAAAAPDLVLTQDLCEICALSYRPVADAVRLLPGAVPVVSLAPRTMDDVFAAADALACLIGREAEARALRADAARRLTRLAEALRGRRRPLVAFLEWLDPPMPGGHWVPEQIAAAGGVPALGTAGAHSVPVTSAQLAGCAAEVVVVGPCGLDRAVARHEVRLLLAGPWADLPAARSGEVWLVDGPGLFNRPGPRVVRGAEVLAAVLHGVGRAEWAEAERVTG